MSEFFENAFLSSTLTGVFFLFLALAAVAINFIVGIFRDRKEQQARIKKLEQISEKYNGHN